MRRLTVIQLLAQSEDFPEIRTRGNRQLCDQRGWPLPTCQEASVSETTINRIRCGHWITAGALFFGGLLIDLMDGHSTPTWQTLLASARILALVLFISGCLLVLIGRIDKIVRGPEKPPVQATAPKIYQLGIMEGERRAKGFNPN